MEYRKLTPQDDEAVAELIRTNLEAYGLDIPGTAYFDEGLDHLSAFYDRAGRAYHVLVEDGKVIGGVGLAETDLFPACCEMQKLYLAESAKGRGLGYALVAHAEDAARRLGYQRIYLETHTNLKAAIHLYEKCGYRQIGKPENAVHGAMDRFYTKMLCKLEKT